jgi:hypothetical protein
MDHRRSRTVRTAQCTTKKTEPSHMFDNASADWRNAQMRLLGPVCT